MWSTKQPHKELGSAVGPAAMHAQLATPGPLQPPTAGEVAQLLEGPPLSGRHQEAVQHIQQEPLTGPLSKAPEEAASERLMQDLQPSWPLGRLRC